MSKTIADLRELLFETLQDVKSGEIDLDKAKTINDIAQTITNTAKAEVEFMKVSGSAGSGFISGHTARPALVGNGTDGIANPPPLPSLTDQLAGANVRTHRMK